MNLFVELRRRNVLRAAVLYASAVWALAQGIAQLGPFFGAPDWTVRWFVLACVVGFPFWIAFAWFYEFTPHGIKRDSEVTDDAPIRHSTARKLDVAIIGILIVAVVLLASGYFIRRNAPAGAATQSAPAKSIAVLPFVNMSGDAKNEYFSDGITVEILNALAQIPTLKVAGRTSAFAFKGKEADTRKIGETLGVATVLEGSVQESGDEVRITVQLVDARSGYQMWSENYDRRLTNIFAIEDEISNAVASKLRLQVVGRGGQELVRRATVDPETHALYLHAIADIARRGPALKDAALLLQQAIARDPGYVDALAALSQVQELLPWYQLADWPGSLVSAEQS
ncbi:MAG TPA: hypothetical protein VFI32_00215, partial [Rhodanobacteraceae bacterium]|nr:hypothetical protein [Rhodanobacteraceae bacterium]